LTLDGSIDAERHPVQLPVTEVFTFGQIAVSPLSEGGFRLSHRSDVETAKKLQRFSSPEDALELSRFDDAGQYRPLKTAPNLRRGWTMELDTADKVWRALDYFYPGRLEILAAYKANRLSITALRETLGRQSGMYRIAATIPDAKLDDVVGEFCRSDGGCLRTILWKRAESGAIPSTKLPPEKFDPSHDQATANSPALSDAVHLPLLCQEACNLLVAECRKAVKGA
jgi:sirohydrochlorin cobaltochelatase